LLYTVTSYKPLARHVLLKEYKEAKISKGGGEEIRTLSEDDP
jgi:hypothetical protein